MNSTSITIGPVRFSFVNVAEPKSINGSALKYSVCTLINKNDNSIVLQCKDAINNAAQQGIEANKFPASLVEKGGIHIPLRDGDEEYNLGKQGLEYKGHWFINTHNDSQPGIRDKHNQPILDPAEFYSGCYGYIHINFFPYNTAGNKGIGASLQHVMKTKDGDRLDGRISANDAFANVAELENKSDDLI